MSVRRIDFSVPSVNMYVFMYVCSHFLDNILSG